MENTANDKFGTMIIDGKIYNLESMSINELDELEQNLRNQIDNKRKEINKFLNIN